MIGQIARSRRSLLTGYPWDIHCVGHDTRRNSRIIQDSIMVARRLLFPGALLAIQCPPGRSASPSPPGAIPKSTSLSLSDVFLMKKQHKIWKDMWNKWSRQICYEKQTYFSYLWFFTARISAETYRSDLEKNSATMTWFTSGRFLESAFTYPGSILSTIQNKILKSTSPISPNKPQCQNAPVAQHSEGYRVVFVSHSPFHILSSDVTTTS